MQKLLTHWMLLLIERLIRLDVNIPCNRAQAGMSNSIVKTAVMKYMDLAHESAEMYITGNVSREKWKDGILTVVPANESITIGTPLLSVHVFLCFLQSDIHVAVDGLEFSY